MYNKGTAGTTQTDINMLKQLKSTCVVTYYEMGNYADIFVSEEIPNERNYKGRKLDRNKRGSRIS